MKGDCSMAFLKTFFWTFFVLAIALLNQAFADPVSKGHTHKTPRGGIIQEAQDMHFEFLIDKNGQANLYLYDKAMKPLERTDLEVKLTVKAHDGTQHSRDLTSSKDPKEGVVFKGEPIKGLTDWDTAVVSLKIKDNWTHLRFSHH
jgi:hypothetical protein